MENGSRPKKPNPTRVSPLRSFGALFGASNGAADTGEAGANGGAEAGVSSAYRVIDEYLREGRRFAENLWTPVGGGPRGPDPSQLTERFMRSAADLSSVWFDLLQSVGAERPGADAPRQGSPGPFDAGQVSPSTASAARAAPARLRVAVRSARLARVDVEFFGEPAGDLAVGPLQALDGGAPPITDVRLSTPGPVLELRIPDAQPDGVYHGVLVDGSTRRPCGAVTLELGET